MFASSKDLQINCLQTSSNLNFKGIKKIVDFTQLWMWLCDVNFFKALARFNHYKESCYNFHSQPNLSFYFLFILYCFSYDELILRRTSFFYFLDLSSHLTWFDVSLTKHWSQFHLTLCVVKDSHVYFLRKLIIKTKMMMLMIMMTMMVVVKMKNMKKTKTFIKNPTDQKLLMILKYIFEISVLCWMHFSIKDFFKLFAIHQTYCVA